MWGCRFFVWGFFFFFFKRTWKFEFLCETPWADVQEPIIMWIYHMYRIYLCKSICDSFSATEPYRGTSDIPWRELCGYSMYCTRFWILLLIIQWGFIFCILHERNITVWLKKMWNKAAIWWFSLLEAETSSHSCIWRDLGGNPSIFSTCNGKSS